MTDRQATLEPAAQGEAGSNGAAAVSNGRARGLRGPSAFSGDWRHSWDLVLATSIASFRTRYVDTTFGFIWMFLGPLLTFAVLFIFITEVVHRFANVPHYGELLLFNVVLMGLFRHGTKDGMRSLVKGGGVLRKLPVPRIVMPASQLAIALYVMAANMIIVFAWMLIAGVQPMWTWLLFPAIVFGMLFVTTGFALLLAGLFVRVRDVGQVWPVISQILFYLSPVMWPFGFIKAPILWDGQSLNPVAPILAQARVWIVDPNAEGWFEARGTGFDSFLPFIITAVIWVAGVIVFVRESRRAAEDM